MGYIVILVVESLRTRVKKIEESQRAAGFSAGHNPTVLIKCPIVNREANLMEEMVRSPGTAESFLGSGLVQRITQKKKTG